MKVVYDDLLLDSCLAKGALISAGFRDIKIVNTLETFEKVLDAELILIDTNIGDLSGIKIIQQFRKDIRGFVCGMSSRDYFPEWRGVADLFLLKSLLYSNPGDFGERVMKGYAEFRQDRSLSL